VAALGRISEETKPRASSTLTVPGTARILIVCQNQSDTERLKTAFWKAGMTSEIAENMTVGCELARSGRFQAVFCTPSLADGSWRRLTDIANRHGLSFEVILLARTFDLNQWLEALQVGAFDVLDVLCDLSKAPEVAKRALRTADRKRFRPRPGLV
jgi:DNA-binding NtrC family response regulator